MIVQNEFATVDLVTKAGVATSGIDAFALSIIKAERQWAGSRPRLVGAPTEGSL
jgi:hypothetical protein